ncbi:MAG: hypothetical protein JXA06_08880 [Bacteroidetes bacterium]|nr:hypothetical protein [Bacteroidota bacterium]
MTIVLSIMFYSCDLFKTRTPQEPSQTSSQNVPATDASLVFQNMIYAFQEGNAFNYAQTIDDSSFFFRASGKALQRYVELSDWNKSKEQGYFTNVAGGVPKFTQITLEFSTVASTNYADSCEIVKTYMISIPSSAAGSQAKVYRGQAQFNLRRDPLKGSWYIRRWSDYELNSSDSTWSDLKGSYVN